MEKYVVHVTTIEQWMAIKGGPVSTLVASCVGVGKPGVAVYFDGICEGFDVYGRHDQEWPFLTFAEWQANQSGNVEQPCQKPPVGWSCSRIAGHDGPCAAIPVADVKHADAGIVVNIQIECSDEDELITHLSVIRSQIKKKIKDGAFEAAQPLPFCIEDNNCYGFHQAKVTFYE